jgi:ribonucleoside-diphosphate reductase alpha chain
MERQVREGQGSKRLGRKRGNTAGTATGTTVPRYFTTPGVNPYDEVAWELRTAVITGEDGKVVFEQKDVEIPKSWSALATNVVASKYFRGTVGTPERERSVKHLVSRVVDTMTDWGRKGGYFASETDAQSFHAELTHLLVRQKGCFNSPVWFNVGVEKLPQCSACFINSVQDSMDSILTLAHTEGMLFKYGSGTGTNLSVIRSSKEKLAGGGDASGPVSFMKGFDAFAGVIKSGGKTRRAAKMVILNADHPDILEFIRCKHEEEKKAWALIDAGYDSSFNGAAYSSVFFQNSNNSVRATDAFMQAVVDDKEWSTHAIAPKNNDRVMDTYRARALFREIAEATHACGDPGMQFDTTVNDWHTCSNTARINASNPCSEYMFLDDTACNLASLNLMHFRNMDGEFDVEAFKKATDIFILAQEIIVDYAKYPTEKIGDNSHKFRPLGLGYANLGALLMSRGLAYDSDAGRAYAAAITALMCGEAYAMSARIAEHTGAFEGYAVNREPMLKVIAKHGGYAERIPDEVCPPELLAAARQSWREALHLGKAHGFRNSQVTVLAPTGTIGFMMDCDTTGIEPDIALIKYKKLVGGGMLKIVNQTVPGALQRLGYSQDTVGRILGYLDEHETIEGAAELKPEHLSVFDCAFKPASGSRSIQFMGHIKMMSSVQPFLSGAISKTVNLPQNATVEDIETAYMESWKLGLKAVAVYRDGCKRSQPLNTSKSQAAATAEVRPARRRLPEERKAITHKFSIGGHEGYLTVGMYEDGTPGELFCVMAKEGSVVSGLMDSYATAISLSLQYGVPLQVLVDKFSHVRFEPSGFTGNPQLPIAKSIVDYVFRWMAAKFLPQQEMTEEGGELVEAVRQSMPAETRKSAPQLAAMGSSGESNFAIQAQADAPPCHTCGSIMVRSGACYKCANCGSTSGCS